MPFAQRERTLANAGQSAVSPIHIWELVRKRLCLPHFAIAAGVRDHVVALVIVSTGIPFFPQPERHSLRVSSLWPARHQPEVEQMLHTPHCLPAMPLPLQYW